MTPLEDTIQLPPSPHRVEGSNPNKDAPIAESQLEVQSPLDGDEPSSLPFETVASVMMEDSFSQDLETLLGPVTHPPKARWFTLLTVILAIAFMGILPLLNIPLPNIIKMLAPSKFVGTGDFFMYSIQWWGYAMVFFTMGPRLATVAYVGLLILSFFIPIFAAGGGFAFILSPSIGFLLSALFIYPILSQKWQRFLHFQFGNTRMKHRKKGIFGRFAHALILSTWCMIALHFFGLIGVGMLAFFASMSGFEAKQWILLHTAFALPYDILGTALIAMGTRWWRLMARPLLYA